MEGIFCSTKANGGQINRSAHHNAQLRTTHCFFPARGADGGTERFVGLGSALLVGLPFKWATDSSLSATLAAQKHADPCNRCLHSQMWSLRCPWTWAAAAPQDKGAAAHAWCQLPAQPPPPAISIHFLQHLCWHSGEHPQHYHFPSLPGWLDD